jgi:tRNA(adenine34) deaminase
MEIDSLRTAIDRYSPEPSYPDDVIVIESIREALAAAVEGNFGVGAVAFRSAGTVVARSQNKMFFPRFRSDGHAEMLILNEIENSGINTDGLSLCVSLEPCPMCMTRLLISRIPRIIYAAISDTGGMARRIKDLPITWQYYAKDKEVAEANCSPTLKRISWSIFRTTADDNYRRVLANE